jgi:hypothetical protein
VGVQLFPAVEAGNRNQEVASYITDQTFHFALVVALRRRSELVREEIVAL